MKFSKTAVVGVVFALVGSQAAAQQMPAWKLNEARNEQGFRAVATACGPAKFTKEYNLHSAGYIRSIAANEVEAETLEGIASVPGIPYADFSMSGCEDSRSQLRELIASRKKQEAAARALVEKIRNLQQK